ncbi:DUF1534 domain-containing protein [Pseudomonas syringae pv. actinidiae]|nr:DUF1534 domain-containing protein [Pseudomonas syringae pv. actinidiae]PIB83387.1 DUF1534 domain-containing protein [Pseudomonas syringae pv. actinidiae]PIH61636.1 DUF1534 domain-containing protein [Pseudomonas syringae pv. actinidiae]PIH67246.1 DUF1534 domain-containing protein [Pseudomonas syringae pv. actinidiae]PIH74720.1 DUF1534 domain-containing protein [Pseudomonas syringae pv. actinidiae]
MQDVEDCPVELVHGWFLFTSAPTPIVPHALRGNACRDALRHKYVPYRASGIGRGASRTAFPRWNVRNEMSSWRTS